MSSSKQLFKVFTQLFFSNVLGQLFFLLAIMHIARTVSPQSFGLWNLAQAWVLYLYRFGEIGLEVVGIRTIARNENDTSSVVWTVVAIRLMILPVIFSVVGVLAWNGFLPPDSNSLILILSLTMLPMALLLEWVYESHQTVTPVAILRILRGGMFFILVLTFVVRENQILNAAYYYVVSYATTTLILCGLAVKNFRLLPVRPQMSLARQLFKAALPVGIANVLSTYSFFVGTILIGYLVGGKELGYYTAAHRLIVFVWAYGIVTTHRVLLPRLSKLYHNSREEMNEFVLKGFRVICIAALPIAIVGVAGGEGIILLLFGEKYISSGMTLSILSVVLAISTIRSVFEIGLLASNQQGLFMKAMLSVAIASTVLSYIGIFYGGIEGAAWAALIVESVYALYLFAKTGFANVFRIYAVAWKPIVLAFVVTFVTLLLGIVKLYVLIPVAVGLYFALLLVTKQVTNKDVEFVLDMVGLRYNRGMP